jgi:hypothetical protein
MIPGASTSKRVEQRPRGREPESEELVSDPALRAKYRAERDKRLRADGNEQYVEVVAEFSHYIDDPYVEPGFTREPVFERLMTTLVKRGLFKKEAAAYRPTPAFAKAAAAGHCLPRRYPRQACG